MLNTCRWKECYLEQRNMRTHTHTHTRHKQANIWFTTFNPCELHQAYFTSQLLTQIKAETNACPKPLFKEQSWCGRATSCVATPRTSRHHNSRTWCVLIWRQCVLIWRQFWTIAGTEDRFNLNWMKKLHWRCKQKGYQNWTQTQVHNIFFGFCSSKN